MPRCSLLFIPAFLLSAQEYAGSSACHPCHTKIYERHFETPMGQSSGRVRGPDSARAGEFQHTRSGVRFRIAERELRFEIGGTKDQRPLEYFIGSGAAARGYLFERRGFWFQIPVAHYSRANRWDMAPGYENDAELDLARPISESCLSCHASGARLTPGTQNHFGAAPFAEGAIGCERCHGPGSAHVNRPGDPILNPARLDPQKRDSVCASCHLRGEVTVNRAGRSQASFRPGDALNDHVVAFVSGTASQPLRVVGHFEGLWNSRCKKSSGDRLWCGSCHDPHSVPPPSERAAHYRAKCLTCHDDNVCRRPGTDCASCHMPKTKAVDGGHTAFTDHAIGARPSRRDKGGAVAELAPFWKRSAGAREFGLAYARLAVQNARPELAPKALDLLESARRNGADDGELLLQLGYLLDLKGGTERAAALYRQARERDPSLVEATANLAVLLAREGRLQEAVVLWRDALERNPALPAVSLSLARALRRLNDIAAARETLKRALDYSPASNAIRKQLAEWRNE